MYIPWISYHGLITLVKNYTLQISEVLLNILRNSNDILEFFEVSANCKHLLASTAAWPMVP